MSLMINARSKGKPISRFMILKAQKKVRGNYLDVLLNRLLKEELIERRKIMGHRGRRVWGYIATEKGYNWWMDPSLRSSHAGYTQKHKVGLVPLEATIEREGWVERWNMQVIHIPNWAATKMQKRMSKPKPKDPAKQRVYDCPAFVAVTTYSKRKGHTLRLKFRLEPWRDHFAEWLGFCGLTLEEVKVFVDEIENQLPGSFKQQEHRVIGSFGSAVRNVEGRFTITTKDLDTGRTMIRTEMEYSRRGELQFSGDGQIVDAVAGALAAYQTQEVIAIAREKGEAQMVRQALILIAQGKNVEAMKLLGVDPGTVEDSDEDVSYFV